MPLDRRSIVPIAILSVVALVGAACSSSTTGKTAPSAADPSIAARPSPVASPSPAASAVPGGPQFERGGSSDAWLVVGRAGHDALQVIQASTDELFSELPVGAPDAAWATMVVATGSDGSTTVRELEVYPEPAGRSQTIDGDWRLPTVGLDSLPAGVSADGQTIVLVDAAAAAAAAPAAGRTSRFAILSRSFAAAPTIVTLDGVFDYDALSPDGATLYLVEHLAAPPEGHYQVRALDTASGALRDGPIADKRNLDEAMAGYPLDQLREPNGFVFTLYRGAEHPFVHALSSVDGWALCIDLPAVDSGDADAALDWGLAASADGRAVYAANATLGVAVEIDANDLSIRRTGRFAAPAAASGAISLAKFGDQPSGPVGRRVVVSPDGSTLFVAGSGGIVRMATDGLTTGRTLLAGSAIDSLALNPDGATLYALLHRGGQIVALDPSTGEIVGRVPGGGFDRLVAIVPW
ncbi:MAG: hypothetical protein HY262_11395 [Chloroflexi bacterium]|nr:hypothetical protein [Chloroflexota bacterium]